MTNRVAAWTVTAVVGVAGSATANNIQVSNVTVTGMDTVARTAYVRFDLSWDNAWRDAENWDAAWVFIKFKPHASNDWQHAALSPVSGDHVPAANSTVTAVPDGTGAFVYRANGYTGNVAYAKMKLKWNYGTNGYAFAYGTQVDVSVHAIEMVYVPQGSFYLGSTGTETGRFYQPDGTAQTTNAYPVTSEDAIEIGSTAGKLWGTSTSGNSTIGDEGTLSADFPKGFKAFYCMKYELTQGQYAAFLNKLTSEQASARYLYTTDHRRTIGGSYPNFVASAPDRACHYINWSDDCAYAEWAGLRPMTELEFEKACRGFAQPVPGEGAWGTANYTLMSNEAGTVGSGSETPLPATANVLSASGFQGPTRAGIFATTLSNRAASGASYWGIMELSGNLFERTITVGNAAGRAFTDSHGTGSLNVAGAATEPLWCPDTALCAGFRGGDWYQPISRTGVSDRFYASLTSHNNRYNGGGWRGVRTAP
jgi:formylglycine-generating enzyme required for sulfatase activity